MTHFTEISYKRLGFLLLVVLLLICSLTDASQRKSNILIQLSFSARQNNRFSVNETG